MPAAVSTCSVRLHGNDAPLVDVDARHARVGEESGSRRLSHFGQGFRRLYRPDGAIARHMDGAVELIGPHDGHQARDLIGADQMGRQPPGGRMAMLALELLPPFRRRGHLQAAHLPVGGFAVELEVAVGLNRVHSEAAGGARDVVLKHKARRVRRRSARPE